MAAFSEGKGWQINQKKPCHPFSYLPATLSDHAMIRRMARSNEVWPCGYNYNLPHATNKPRHCERLRRAATLTVTVYSNPTTLSFLRKQESTCHNQNLLNYNPKGVKCISPGSVRRTPPCVNLTLKPLTLKGLNKRINQNVLYIATDP